MTQRTTADWDWIWVGERQPVVSAGQDFVPVLVATYDHLYAEGKPRQAGYEVAELRFDAEGFKEAVSAPDGDEWWPVMDEVTHWRPLPAPPGTTGPGAGQWRAVAEQAPLVPEGHNVVTVIAALFDAAADQVAPGSGWQVRELMYSAQYGFEEHATGAHPDRDWRTPQLPVTHWMYRPEPPTYRPAPRPSRP